LQPPPPRFPLAAVLSPGRLARRALLTTYEITQTKRAEVELATIILGSFSPARSLCLLVAGGSPGRNFSQVRGGTRAAWVCTVSSPELMRNTRAEYLDRPPAVNKILVTDGAGNCGEHPGALISSKPLSGFKTALGSDETGAQAPLHPRMSSSPADESRRHAYPQQLPHAMAANPAKGDASTFQLPPPIWGSPALSQMTWEGQRNGNPGARRAIQKALDGGPGCQGMQKALEVGRGCQGWDGIQKALGGGSDYSISLTSSPAPAANQRRGVTLGESFDMPRQLHHRTSIADRSWTTPPMVGPSSSLSLSPGGSENSSAGSGTFCVSAYGKDLVLSVSASGPRDFNTRPRTLSHLPTE
jgi:hypothetical protein